MAVDSSLASPPWSEGLHQLARQTPAPLVVVGDCEPKAIIEVFRHGALWLPTAAIQQPGVLSVVLDQAAALGGERRQAAADRTSLQESQERFDRLLGLIGEATPGDGPPHWFTQRSMLERLDEEVARSQRYGVPLSVVIGEMRLEPGERLAPEHANRLARWLAGCIGKGKRRSDVAGQYGLNGFMMLLPQASAAQAREACKRLRRLLADPPHDGPPRVHACFGLASAPVDVATARGLLRQAEERLEQDPDESDY